MRVLFILPHPIEGPSSRFRVYQYLPYLHAHGVETAVRPFMPSRHVAAAFGSRRPVASTVAPFFWWTLRRCRDILGARRWDIVFVHRDAFPFGPPVFEALLKRASRRLVFDFDDFIFERSHIFRPFWDRLKDPQKTARVIRMADHTIVGNEFLRQHALRYSPRVTVIPTVVDTDHYVPPPARRTTGPVTVGWIGTPSSTAYVEWLIPTFRKVAAASDVRFHCVGIPPLPAAGLPIRFTPWSLASERADLGTFDIGVMPLFDDDEARGKCGLKLLQYMAYRAVAVGSPIGANTEIVQHMQNGLLASDEAEWAEALTRLVIDRELRERLGTAWRATVEARYSVKAAAPRLLQVLTDTLSGA